MVSAHRTVVAASVIGLVALAVTATASVSQLRSQRVAAQMSAIADHTADPSGVRPLPRGRCPDQTTLVRCSSSLHDVDTLTRHYQEALSRAAGRPAGTTCDRGPAAGAPSCTVRVDSGEHAVMIQIDTVLDRSSGRPESTGSLVRIDAD